jgi:uncharacterized protein involved in outer membrane biogenesis
LQVHFISALSGPEVRMSGDLKVDQLDVRDSEDAPLASFNRLSVGLDDLQPLRNIMHFGQIDLDGLTVDIVRKPDGATNLTSLAMNKPAAASTRAPAARSTPAPAGAQATPAGIRSNRSLRA